MAIKTTRKLYIGDFKKEVLILVMLSLVTPSLLWASNQNKIIYEELSMNNTFCFNWGFLVDVPQYKRNQGEPYLDAEYVIDSQESYLDFQNKIGAAKTQACSKVDFPSIDFSQRTLLAKYASGSCASTSFVREVFKDDEKKEIIYSVKAIERHIACSGPGLDSMNLIIIPKIPKNYNVEFVPPFDTSGYQSYTCENGKMVAKDWNGNIVEPRNTPPPGGGIFGVQMDCGNVETGLQKLPMDVKKLMIESGGDNIPPPCPEGTHLEGQYCAKGSK